MCHTVYFLIHISLLANVYCHESIVFKASYVLTFAALLILGPHWGSPWMSYCYPVLWRPCNIESAGQVPSCVAAIHRWGGCWGELTQPWIWTWVVAESASLQALQHPHHRGELSRFVLPVHPVLWLARGSTSSCDSTTPTPPGPALLFCPCKAGSALPSAATGEGLAPLLSCSKGQLSFLLWVMRDEGRDIFPVPMGPAVLITLLGLSALPPPTGSELLCCQGKAQGQLSQVL